MTTVECIHCRDNGVQVCDGTRCDAADPARPWAKQTAPTPCRPCWVRLGGLARHPATPAAPAPPPLQRGRLPCVHLGAETGEVRDCPSCQGSVRVKVRRCAKHGGCTTGKALPGVVCCATCPDHEPDTFSLVAPVGTRGAPGLVWEGRAARKPWHYRVTALIPHLDTLEPLEVVLETLRLQTERPYLVVVDTGSPPEVCEQLEQFRAEDCEIHYVRGHGYIQSSGAVTTALDLGFGLVRSEFAYCTHTDVFLKRRDYLAWLVSQCGPEAAVVGYEMSDRSWATQDWRGIPSHTASLYHMPTIRRHGLCWSMDYAYQLAGWVGKAANGWPDTETGFGLQLHQKGVPVRLIGRERNFERFEDDNLVHARSYGGSKVYGSPRLAQSARWLEAAMADARARAAGWRREDARPSPPPRPDAAGQ